MKTFTNNNADTYKSYIRRTCTPKPWPPFGHLFEELFSIGARIRYVKNINAYNNKQLLISRGAWGVPVPGTRKREDFGLLFFLFLPQLIRVAHAAWIGRFRYLGSFPSRWPS